MARFNKAVAFAGGVRCCLKHFLSLNTSTSLWNKEMRPLLFFSFLSHVGFLH